MIFKFKKFSPLTLKGIVHPKMKILSSFTQVHTQVLPSSSSKPVWISLFCRTQRKIFWRKFVTRLFWHIVDFHSRKKKYYGSQRCPRTALFPTFFKISSFVFSRTKTFIQVWKYLRGSKWWPYLYFWANCPFNPSYFLPEHQWVFEPFLIVVFESLSCARCEKMDLKIIQSLLERVQICKWCWKTEDSAGHGGLYWRKELSLTVQNKQGTLEQPSQNKKQLWSYGLLRTKFLSISVNICFISNSLNLYF